MLMVTLNGFLSRVGEPCSLCRLFRIRMMTKTMSNSNIMAVSTPITTSTYVSLSFLAATVTKKTVKIRDIFIITQQ